MVEYHEIPMRILPSGILSNMGPLKYGGGVLMLPTMTCKISEAQNKHVYCSVLHATFKIPYKQGSYIYSHINCCHITLETASSNTEAIIHKMFNRFT
jgi:hypothetical protein